MPMFNGFISELFIYLGMLDGLNRNNFNLNIGSILCAAGLTFVGALALFAFVRLYGLAFLGEPRSDKAKNAVEVSRSMLTTPVILAGLCFLLGLPGSIYLRFFKPILQYQNMWFEISPTLTKAFNLVSLVFLIIGTLILIMLFLRRRIVKTTEPTWGCGYERPNPRMQYTGNSLIHPLAYFIRPFIKKRDVMNYDKAIFPEGFTFEVRVHEFLHDSLIAPVKRAILSFLNLFAGIQKGNTQVYISYGLVFLLIVLTWAILVVK
jgi:hydrogenase-4 component B